MAAAPKGGSDLIPLLIDPKTSNLKTGPQFGLTTTSSQTPSTATRSRPGWTRSGVGDLSLGIGKGAVEEVCGSNGLKIFAGPAAKEADEITALGFIPHLLQVPHPAHQEASAVHSSRVRHQVPAPGRGHLPRHGPVPRHRHDQAIPGHQDPALLTPPGWRSGGCRQLGHGAA